MIKLDEIQTKYPKLYAFIQGQGEFNECEAEPYDLTDHTVSDDIAVTYGRMEVFASLGYLPGFNKMLTEYLQQKQEVSRLRQSLPSRWLHRGIINEPTTFIQYENAKSKLAELDEDIQKSMISAVRGEHLAYIKNLIQTFGGKYLNKRPGILMEVIIRKQTDIAKYLLSIDAFRREATSRSLGYKAYSPLALAIETEQPEMIDLLLNNYALDDTDRIEAAMFAAKAGNVFLLKKMLQKIAFKYLRIEPMIDGVRILDTGFKSFFPDNLFFSQPILIQIYAQAAAFDHATIMQTMLEAYPRYTMDYHTATLPLFEALARNQLNAVQWLFEHAYNPSTIINDEDHLNIIQRLFEIINISLPIITDPILTFAVSYSNKACVNYLVEKYTLTETQLIDLTSRSLERGNIEVADLLIKKIMPIGNTTQTNLINCALKSGYKPSLDLLTQCINDAETTIHLTINNLSVKESLNIIAEKTGDVVMFNWWMTIPQIKENLIRNFDGLALLRKSIGAGHWQLVEQLFETPGMMTAFASTSYDGWGDVFTQLRRRVISDSTPNPRVKAAVARLLFHNINLLNWVETHNYEFGSLYTRPFVQDLLITWRERDFTIHPLTEHEAKVACYALRHLLRRNESRAALVDENASMVAFILEQPAIRTAIASNSALIISIYDLASEEMLIRLNAFPEIAIARSTVQLRGQAGNHENLAAIGRNKESSLRALTPAEKEGFELAFQHYGIHPDHPDAQFIDQQLYEMRKALVARYEKHPATVYLRGKIIRVPCHWGELQTFIRAKRLTATEQSYLLKALYRNDTHTTLRYLSENNHFLNPDAVYVSRDNQGRCHSDYPSYAALIVTLWKAASDINPNMVPPSSEDDIRPIEERIEDRITLLLHEFALIGRAHNYDKSELHPRPVTDKIFGRKLYFEPALHVREQEIADCYCWSNGELTYIQRDGQLKTPTIHYPQIFKQWEHEQQRQPKHLTDIDIEQYITDNGGHIPDYQPLLNENQIRTEEFDDLEGDKPSCYSGMNKRFAQSVLGHPLVTVGSLKEKLLSDTKAFVREHFKSMINQDNCHSLHEALNKLVVDSEDEIALQTLQILDIPLAKQQAFEEKLQQTYGPGVKRYTKMLNELFDLRATHVHAMQFYFECEDMLKKLISQKAHIQRAFFQATTKVSDEKKDIDYDDTIHPEL